MYSTQVLGRLLGLRIGAYIRPFKNIYQNYLSVHVVRILRLRRLHRDACPLHTTEEHHVGDGTVCYTGFGQNHLYII